MRFAIGAISEGLNNVRLMFSFVGSLSAVASIFLGGCGPDSVSADTDDLAAQHAYFAEVVLGTETGSGPRVVRKWTGDLRIAVSGEPTEEDLQTLSEVITDLNELVAPVALRVTSETPTVDAHFVPEAEFSSVLPEYRPPSRGFHWVNWNEYGEIQHATILISTTGLSQAERSHIIREELTQSLGLLMDSRRYPDSIFYSGWTTTSEFSDLDRSVIRLLYSPEIQPGTVPAFAD
jgi:hypothetical protein